MSLLQYKKKRKFAETTEPSKKGKTNGGQLIFVVQKHAASHLHYDFRLEMEGLLKSWAVPKGPSMNANDKRLAMMVEDHPYSYKDFEGNIPAGNYGAGNVIVWDNGTYTPLDDEDKKHNEALLLAGLKKGHISFILQGKKLKGEFSLVKLKGKQENAWLLIKKNDKYAVDTDVLIKNKSVLSNVTLEAMTKKSEAPVKKAAATNSKKKEVKKKPEFVSPMLAKLVKEPFDKENWLFEIKYDGYRAMALCTGDGNVDLYSRNFLSFNDAYSSITKELGKISHSCLLDGEIVVEDKRGRAKFQLIQNYQGTKEERLKYYVFDILSLDGADVTNLPLEKRKQLLKLLLQKSKLKDIFYSDHIEAKGVAFFKLADKKGLEGVMAKDAESIYTPGARNGAWLKVKITNEEEAVIAGITAPQGSRNYFGSLILGMYRNGKLEYIGHCGTGFDHKALKSLYNKFKPLFSNTSPFGYPVQVNAKVQWLKPQLVCEVKFTEWTQDRIMRNPVYLGLRIDKSAVEVTGEKITKMKKTATKAKSVSKKETTLKSSTKQLPGENDFELKIGKQVLKLTNQQKIYWPADGITKGDLINYYKEIAPVILPYLKNRPQSLHRFPNGINDAGFYQKDLDTKVIPNWLHTQKVYSESNNKNLDYLICNDKETLIYMANLGCIEINPWNSRIKKIQNPDWLVIDLDPEEISFSEVVKAALATKKVFDQLEIESYCKTSGATGLHIFVPLAAKYEYEVVRNFAQLIAHRVNEMLPDTTSILRMPKQRQHKVYLDFLQNSRGQTLASPYSVRPRAGATVSTPLNWNEVNAKLLPADFTMHNLLKRLDKKGDLWKPVLGKGANLQHALKKASVSN